MAIKPQNRIVGKLFVKDEGYFKTNKMKPRVVMEVSDLRSILPISPACNAVADYWHMFDSTLCPPIIFLTGLSREVVDRWFQTHCSRHPHAVENDFAEFESRVSLNALELEFRTYDALGLEHLRPWFNQQKKMVLFGDGVRFTRRGGRMSGVPNTSIGNSIINFTLHKHFFDLGGLTAGIDYAMAVNGDDNVIFCNRAAYDYCSESMAGYFARMNMKAELVLHLDRTNANFCSSRFGQLPNGQHVLAVHPFRAMAKLGKCPGVGFAGPDTIVQLCRDYSSTPNFWPLHVFCRHWLRTMGYSYEVSESLPYDCPLTPATLSDILRQNRINRDGSWRIARHSQLQVCFEAEGLVECPTNPRNFSPPPRLYGLPPNWGRPGWVRKARDIRNKMLNFWKTSEYTGWQPRLEVALRDASINNRLRNATEESYHRETR